jgi:hypothetical protein
MTTCLNEPTSGLDNQPNNQLLHLVQHLRLAREALEDSALAQAQ